MNKLYFDYLGPKHAQALVESLHHYFGDPDLVQTDPRTSSPNQNFAGINMLTEATPTDISFCESKKMNDALANTNAGLVFGPEDLRDIAPQSTAYVSTPFPRVAFAHICGAFYHVKSLAGQKDNVHPTAKIATSAKISGKTMIGEGAVIGKHVEIGGNCAIGPGVKIQDGTKLLNNISLTCCAIGRNSHIQSGTVIGDPGYAIAVGPKGTVEVPQLGDVVIGDNVMIGSNCAIDRGALGPTIIGNDTKIDNICHIAHNCQIGNNVIITANVAMAGSTILEDFVQVGGGVSIADHLTIGKNARIVGHSGLMNNIPAGETWGGYPAQPWTQFKRSVVRMRKLVKNG